MKTRENNYDLLRCVSAFCVIILHINAMFLRNKMQLGLYDTETFIQTFINIATRFTVPVFVMLSGAFVLNKVENRNAISFYKKTFRRIGVPFFFVFFAWLAADLISNTVSTKEVVKKIIHVSYGNLWFVPMILGLYLCVPVVIRLKTNALTCLEYRICAVSILLASIVSNAVSPSNVPYSIGTIGSFFGYFLMGDVLFNLIIPLGGKRQLGISISVLLGSVIILPTLSMAVRRSLNITRYDFNPYTSFFSPTIVLLSLLVFLAFKIMPVRKDMKWLSGNTYYIYLIHTAVYTIVIGATDLFSQSFVGRVMLVVVTFTISLMFSEFTQQLSRLLNRHEKTKTVGEKGN